MSPSPIQRLKPYFKPRPRAGAKPAAAAPVPAAPSPGPPPTAAAAAASPPSQQPPSADGAPLQARREQLARRYSELESELGGLVYEMAIRDHFRLDVVVKRAAELQAVDAELGAVEQQLGVAAPAPAAAPCPSCGTPTQPGAQYCGRCGSGIAPAVAAR